MSRLAKALGAQPKQKPVPGPTYGAPLGVGSTFGAPVVGGSQPSRSRQLKKGPPPRKSPRVGP